MEIAYRGLVLRRIVSAHLDPLRVSEIMILRLRSFRIHDRFVAVAADE
jgi:hypothetical protein